MGRCGILDRVVAGIAVVGWIRGKQGWDKAGSHQTGTQGGRTGGDWHGQRGRTGHRLHRRLRGAQIEGR